MMNSIFLENDDSIRMNANSVHPEINSIAEYIFLSLLVNMAQVLKVE